MNISPSPTELAIHDLTHFIETATNQVDTSNVLDGFENFTTPPPPNVYMMSNLFGSSSAQPHKKQKLDTASHDVKYDTSNKRSRTHETMISKVKQPLINPDIDNPHKSGEKQSTTSLHDQSHNIQVQSTHSKSTSNHEQTHNIQVQSPHYRSIEEDFSSSRKEYSLIRKEIDNLKKSGLGSANQSGDGDDSHDNEVAHHTHFEGNESGDTKKAATEEVHGVDVSKDDHQDYIGQSNVSGHTRKAPTYEIHQACHYEGKHETDQGAPVASIYPL